MQILSNWMTKSLENKLHLQRRATALLFYSKFLLKISNFEFIEGLRIATNQVHSVLPNESKNGFRHCIVHSILMIGWSLGVLFGDANAQT